MLSRLPRRPLPPQLRIWVLGMQQSWAVLSTTWPSHWGTWDQKAPVPHCLLCLGKVQAMFNGPITDQDGWLTHLSVARLPGSHNCSSSETATSQAWLVGSSGRTQKCKPIFTLSDSQSWRLLKVAGKHVPTQDMVT